LQILCVKILFCKHYGTSEREGSGAGSVPLTNGSGSWSSKNMCSSRSGSLTLSKTYLFNNFFLVCRDSLTLILCKFWKLIKLYGKIVRTLFHKIPQKNVLQKAFIKIKNILINFVGLLRIEISNFVSFLFRHPYLASAALNLPVLGSTTAFRTQFPNRRRLKSIYTNEEKD
jgi:hypothetical protein